MTEFGDSLKATVRSIISGLVVNKAAGAATQLAVRDAVIDLLCDELGRVDECVKETNKVLRAIAYPVGYPLEWKAWRGEVPVNGHANGHHRGHDLGSN